MINRYVNNPYEKKYISKVKNRINKNKKIYISPEENIVFLGNKNIVGDEFTINEKQVTATLINNLAYFNLDSDTIEMEINYQKRLDIMQQNISNAIVRICINKTTKYKIKDYYIDENINKIILDEKDIAFEAIDKLEDLCNYLIFSNSLIKYENHKINIKGFGNTSYIGPLLKRTGEIGIIKISNIYKKDSNIVVEILGGQRAYYDYRSKSKNLWTIKSQLFIDNEEDILKEIKNIKSKNSSAIISKSNPLNTEITTKIKDKKENKKENAENSKNDSSSLYKLQGKINGLINIATTVNEKNYIYKVIKNANIKEMEEISNEISNKRDFIQIYGLIGYENSTSSILVSRSKNLNLDLKKIFLDLSNKFQMKGSGNMFQVKATVKTEELSKIMETFLIAIKNN